VIAGSDHIAREIASKIAHHPEMLCRVVGFLFPEDRVDNSVLTVESLAESHDVSTLEVTDLLDLHEVDELIVALPQPATAELVRLATQCQQRGIGVSLVPQPYDLYLSRPKLLDLDGLPILKLCEPSVPQLFLKSKRALDIALGAILFVPSLVDSSECFCAARFAGTRLSVGPALRNELQAIPNVAPQCASQCRSGNPVRTCSRSL